MSMAICVFLNKADLPAVPTWQQAVDRLGYRLTLDPSWDPINDSGVWPGSLNGQHAAFEYALDAADLLVADDEHLPALAKDYDSGVSLTFGGRMPDCAAALICAATLANLVPSFLYDPEAGETCLGSEAVAYVEPILTELQVFPQ